MFSNRNNKIITKILQGGDLPIQPMGQPDQQQMNQPSMGQMQPIDQQQMNQPPIEQPSIEQINQPPIEQPSIEQMNQPSMGQMQPMGQQQINQPSMEQINQPSMEQINQPSMEQQPPIEQMQMSQSFSNENYPNPDYLYNKITSQNFTNNIKTYVCAITINKDIDTHFVKYIVNRKESYVTFPSFLFEQSAMNSVMNPSMNPNPMNSNPMNSMNSNPMNSNPMNPNPMNPNPMNPNPMNPNPMNPNPMNPNPMNSNPMNPVMPQNGGFQDDSSGEENPLDTIFKTKVIEFVKTTMYGGLLEPSYIGYIPNISEQDSVFVFVKIDESHNKHFMSSASAEYLESTPNELFHLFKVFNLDVEQVVKNLFLNNPWICAEQSLASPFSGYLCKMEGSEIKNAGIGEEPGNLIINIDNIGDFFYFSFLPLDPNNANLYQRYALLPMEYECILDNANLEYYKQNIISYQNSNSIYFKGEILSNPKEGNQFFAIRSPTQFTQF
jgi:hypothetical protein